MTSSKLNILALYFINKSSSNICFRKFHEKVKELCEYRMSWSLIRAEMNYRLNQILYTKTSTQINTNKIGLYTDPWGTPKAILLTVDLFHSDLQCSDKSANMIWTSSHVSYADIFQLGQEIFVAFLKYIRVSTTVLQNCLNFFPGTKWALSL